MVQSAEADFVSRSQLLRSGYFVHQHDAKRRYTFLRTDVLHSPASRQPNCLAGQFHPSWVLTKESDISAELAGFVPSGPTARAIYEFGRGRRSSSRQLTSLLPASRKWLGSIFGTLKKDRIYV